ncbi:MAG TPA: glycosyltransferase family 39 protein [Candidatus Acidoferrum sp.]|nr:glycosyltransferase family 39 protein [Candidatus Acidoferrum sp.]
MFMLKVQELIHRFEVGSGARAVRGLFLACAFATVALLYDSFCFKNFSTEEAMDAAQLARNIADGEGFTTRLIRPFSMFLISRQRADKDPLIKKAHPDIMNAPVYPVLLAAVVKLTPAQDMVAEKSFSRAWGDLGIAIFNQMLLLIALGLVYLLTRQWFDEWVAMIAALLFGLTELYWRFSVSGLSTNLLLVLVLLLALCLAKLEAGSRAQASRARLVLLALLTGMLLGVIGLTRYSCAFLIVPAVAFMALFITRAKGSLIAIVITAFFLCLAPWVARNMMVTGVPFGVASYAPVEQTRIFPGDRLQRSLHPDLALMQMGEYTRKLVTNTREVITNDLPRMGGNWLWAFFLAGLLLRFRNPTLSRMRWFVVIAIITLIPVQALVRTQSWTASPDVNSENLLVVLSPLVLIFGTSVFFVLLDSVELPSNAMRYAAWTGFAAVMSLPLILSLLPPHGSPVSFPPYYPPYIQQIGRWLGPRDLIMTDVPAAVAWYGRSQALAITTTWKDEFTEIHDYQKPIRALYLTPVTTERKFLANWMAGEKLGWEAFVLDTLTKEEVPTGFPLKHANSSFFRDGQVLLMDYPRWRSGRKDF